MRTTLAACLITALVPCVSSAADDAAPKASATGTSDASTNTDKLDAAIERVLTERESTAALQAAIDAARKAGVGEQVILEARFLFLVDQNDDAGIAALLPDFIKRNESFKPEDSRIFATREDWLAVVEYVHAIAALRKHDKDAFKRHITEAFWLSPRQGAAFAPHIERLRLDEAMRTVKVDLDQEFVAINTDVTQSLKKIITPRKALLLHFWSPASDESLASLADFAVAAKTLLGHDIAVASVQPDASAQMRKDARDAFATLGENPPGVWIADHQAHSLARLLRVTNVPTMVLVDTNGAVLFNGDPGDDALWSALAKIHPAIKRPALTDSGDDR